MTTDLDLDKAVEARAAKLVLARSCEDVLAAGVAAFPDFAQSVQVVSAACAGDDEFLADIVEGDKTNAHVLIRDLASDPDRIRQLVALPSRQRVAELTRMRLQKSTPAPRAAAPVLVADSGGLGENLSDAEFSRAWNRKYLGK